jgi:hypothetical protein
MAELSSGVREIEGEGKGIQAIAISGCLQPLMGALPGQPSEAVGGDEHHFAAIPPGIRGGLLLTMG